MKLLWTKPKITNNPTAIFVDGNIVLGVGPGGNHVVVDPKSAVYVVGTTIDYVDDLQQSGFKIDNPNATNTCGCGESFGA